MRKISPPPMLSDSFGTAPSIITRDGDELAGKMGALRDKIPMATLMGMPVRVSNYLPAGVVAVVVLPREGPNEMPKFVTIREEATND